jgi:hypothetical protein
MRSLSLFALLIILPSSAVAQSGASSGISVNGSADMTKPPELIRLHVKQYAKGNDEDSAKSALIAAEKKLLTKLGEAGAEVIHAAPAVAQPSPNLQSRFQNFRNLTVNRRALGGVANNNPAAEMPSVFLERFVSVDVKPKNKQKEVLVLTGELQDKLRKDYLDLSGLNEVYGKDKDDTNDGQPNTVTMSVMRNDMHYYQQDVQVYLAARITRDDRVKLYELAIKKARSIAEDLAAAAGVGLGELQTIGSSFSASSTNNFVLYNGTRSGDAGRFPFFKDDPTCEAVAVRQLNPNYNSTYQPPAEPLTYQVSLNVSYKIVTKR